MANIWRKPSSVFSVSQMPHNGLVPKAMRANLEFRLKVLEEGLRDKETARDLWRMCSEDPLFFVNTFGWTYDPRLDVPEVPWILYPFQEAALLDLINATGVTGEKAHDALIEKSRDMGASWLCLTSHVWLWQFGERYTFLWLSRKEEYVDKTGDPKTLFWKLDFFLDHLPPFLKPQTVRTHLHIENSANGATIDGEATTGDMGVGDRRLAVLLDEFSKVKAPDDAKAMKGTADVTRCRIFNATPEGTNNAYYRKAHTPGIHKLRFHWSVHPEKARGLYTTGKDGGVKKLDKSYVFPADYPFILDGKLRSPWYDYECARRASALEIAQQLDIDYLTSGGNFFDGGVLDRAEREDVRPPYMRGELVFDDLGIPTRFQEGSQGRLLLWTYLDAKGKPHKGRDYVEGVDVSAGSDASNSCASLGDALSGEKVGELAVINMFPSEFAIYCVALSRWFTGDHGEAYMIWEANGPGREFGARAIATGAKRYYLRKRGDGLRAKKTQTPGWFTTEENKTALIGDYRRALGSRLFINRSAEAIAEAREYVYVGGTCAHPKALNSDDPSGAKHNHGDRVIADTLCWKGMSETRQVLKVGSQKVPEHCYAARMLRARAKEKAKASVW